MSDENKPEQSQPQPAEKTADKPAAAEAPPATPGDKPATEKVAAGDKPGAVDKPAQGDKPSEAVKPAAAAATAKPAAPPAAEKTVEAPKGPGKFGQLLGKNKIDSTPLPDSTAVETIEVEAKNLERTMKLLRENKDALLNFLVTVSGVDSPDTIDSVYHLRSFYNQNELVVKVRIPKSSIPAGQLPLVPSLANDWQTANWHERETYDLVGIRYIGHPYLRRILNPWDWEGHPLRRDYKQVIDALNDKSPGSFR